MQSRKSLLQIASPILLSQTLSFLTSMLVAEVGEPPDIAESNGVAEAGEEEVALVAPGAPLCLLLIVIVVCRRQVGNHLFI